MQNELYKLYFSGDGLDHDYVDLRPGSISFGVAMKLSEKYSARDNQNKLVLQDGWKLCTRPRFMAVTEALESGEYQ